MTRPSRPLLISYILFGVALAIFIGAMIVGSSEAKRGMDNVRAAESAAKEDATVEPTSQPAGQEAVQDEAEQHPQVIPETNSTNYDPATPDPAVIEQNNRALQGGHIPFTQDPVTPGDPESYVDTVGQCPFYEMAGPKGCTPPPDIECNADWSVCTKKEL